TKMSAATPVFVIVIGKLPCDPGAPSQQRPFGKPSAFPVEAVLTLLFPPAQPPNVADDGETVTATTVGTTLREIAMLCPLPGVPAGCDAEPGLQAARPAAAASATAARATAGGFRSMSTRSPDRYSPATIR